MSVMEITFATFATPDGQDRLAVFCDGLAVCRAPSLRASTARHTEPGSVVWVLSENSKALRRLERQLKDGSRVLRPAKTKADKALLKKSVLQGVSFLSDEDLAALTTERAGVAVALDAKAKARKAAKAKKPAKKAKAKAGPTQAQMDALQERLRLLEASAGKKAAQG